jgi:hypothetical protein
MEKGDFWVILLEDLFNGMVIESHNSGQRSIINPFLEVYEIVRTFLVIVSLIQFLKD